MLAAGRPVPAAGEPMKRGEGVAIVLSGPAITTWKTAGGRGSPCLSLHACRPVAGKLTIYTCCPAMHRHGQPVEQLRMSSSGTLSMHWPQYHQRSHTSSLETLMLVWGLGVELMTCGMECEV